MGWQKLGKHMIVGWAVLVFVLLAGCSNGLQGAETYGEVSEREWAEAEAQALDPTGWVTVAPGFRYRLEESGIGFSTTPGLLTEEGLQRVEDYVEALKRAAVKELDRIRLDAWKRQLERARANAQDWQVALPKLVQEYQMILAERYGVTVTSETVERMLRQEIEPMFREDEGVTPHNFPMLAPPIPACDLAASAMRTTAQPGAKAFARGVCSGGIVRGFIYSETTAETGTQWPLPCTHTGRSMTQCSSTAFGRSGCFSSAKVEVYVRRGNTYVIVAERFREHSDPGCR